VKTESEAASFLEALPSGAALVDEKGAIIAVNGEFTRLAGLDAAELRATDSSKRSSSSRGARGPRAVPEATGSSPRRSRGAALRSRARRFRVRLASWRDGPRGRALVTVEEVTSERRLRRAAEAYEGVFEIASRVRHEINNSLMG